MIRIVGGKLIRSRGNVLNQRLGHRMSESSSSVPKPPPAAAKSIIPETKIVSAPKIEAPAAAKEIKPTDAPKIEVKPPVKEVTPASPPKVETPAANKKPVIPETKISPTPKVEAPAVAKEIKPTDAPKVEAKGAAKEVTPASPPKVETPAANKEIKPATAPKMEAKPASKDITPTSLPKVEANSAPKDVKAPNVANVETNPVVKAVSNEVAAVKPGVTTLSPIKEAVSSLAKSSAPEAKTAATVATTAPPAAPKTVVQMQSMKSNVLSSSSTVLKNFNPTIKMGSRGSMPFQVMGGLAAFGLVSGGIYYKMKTHTTWTPKNRLLADMHKFLESAKITGDVTFQVDGQQFPAHLYFLAICCPDLAKLAEKNNSVVHVDYVEPFVFESFLHYLYTNEVPTSETVHNEAQPLLEIADRFRCIGLKLMAEKDLVETGITVDTVAELILLAHDKNCALLKEAAVEFFAGNPAAVMSSVGWTKVTKSPDIMRELMQVLVGQESAESDDYKYMRVADLRKMLEDKDLHVDGSRAMLIDRLERNKPDYLNSNETVNASTVVSGKNSLLA